jgi:hypothetical protein
VFETASPPIATSLTPSGHLVVGPAGSSDPSLEPAVARRIGAAFQRGHGRGRAAPYEAEGTTSAWVQGRTSPPLVSRFLVRSDDYCAAPKLVTPSSCVPEVG